MMLTSEKGSLYLDALVGMALLACVLLAVSPMFILSTRGNASSGDLTVSAMLAHEKMEELKAINYSFLPLGTGMDTIRVQAIDYERTWTVENNVPQVDMKTVTVTVTPSRQSPLGPRGDVTVSMYRVP